MTLPTLHADILVKGDGITALALALTCHKQGFSVILVAKSPSQQPSPDVVALAPSVVAQLKSLCPLPPMTALKDMLLYDNLFKTNTTPSSFSLPAKNGKSLAWVCSTQPLYDRLHTAVKKAAIPVIISNDTWNKVTVHKDKISLYNAQQKIMAKLCLAADGAASPLRQSLGIQSYGTSYAHKALTAHITHTRPHHGRAIQFFFTQGTLAFLPMSGMNSFLIWVQPSQKADAIKNLTNKKLLHEELTNCTNGCFGAMQCTTPFKAHPLKMHLAASYIAPRLALVGDAAHVVHPLAGQGLNMGLRDSGHLSHLLHQAKKTGADIGSRKVLHAYQQNRRKDNALWGFAIDGINSLLCQSPVVPDFMKKLAFSTLESLPPFWQEKITSFADTSITAH